MNDELNDLLSELATAHSRNRTPLDVYREFREVFLGTDVGRRVFYDILSWGRISAPCAVKADPYETYRREGARELALRLIAAVHVEPRERPQPDPKPIQWPHKQDY